MVPLRRVLLTLRRRMDCRLRRWTTLCRGWRSTKFARFRSAQAIGDNAAMNIQLNGEPRTLPASATLHDLLQAEQLLQRRVAVEVNGEIVSRSRHGEHVLAEGDVVEIDTRWAGAEACAGVQGSDPFADGKGI
jgi:sulfur carrier protein